jgi:hypothetical protein
MEKDIHRSENTCPVGMDSIRKIGLTPKEKRTIFRSILNLTSKENFKETGDKTPVSLSFEV